jgi:hypothetical protein
MNTPSRSVTGIFAFTFAPQVATVSACLSISSSSSAYISREIGRSSAARGSDRANAS